MRKVITLMALALLVVGFSIPALATVVTTTTCPHTCPDNTVLPNLTTPDPLVQCETTAAHINRGCIGQNSDCGAFNYESFGHCSETGTCKSYCEGAKGDQHKAGVALCACIDKWGGVIEDTDSLNISMEIIIKKTDGTICTGDNGVYWADTVQSIGVNWYNNFQLGTDAMCADTRCEPGDEEFDGVTYDNPCNGKAWKLHTTNGLNNANWKNGNSKARNLLLAGATSVYGWIDVPRIYVDPNAANAISRGDEILVKFCLLNSRTTTCAPCCNIWEIGYLCCVDTVNGNTLLFPYLTPMQGTDWWFGIAITNTSDTAGVCTITVYEQDGSQGTGTTDNIAAHSMAIFNMDTLFARLSGAGLGNSPSYITVKAPDNMNIEGFAMMGNTTTTQSMGYLPIDLGR